MMIHSVSYEKGDRDYATPTLNDGFNWMDILKEGLMLKCNWPMKLKEQMLSVWNVLQNPEYILPSFHRNSFSKLDTAMQEHLFDLLNNTCNSTTDPTTPEMNLQLNSFYKVSDFTTQTF